MRQLLILTLFISFQGISQQEPISSFYWNNYSYFNPAMSGVEYKHEANVTYRNQWDKVSGAPKTLFLNYGTNLAEKHGLGANYVYERIGFNRAHQVKLNYNYQLKLDEDRKLVLGTAVGFYHLRTNPDWVAPSTQNDPFLPNAFTGNYAKVDLGVAYYGEKLIAGISATQIPIYAESDNYNFATHLFGTVRYELTLPSSDGLIFRTQMRTDLVKYSQYFNIGYQFTEFGEQLEIGLGYRTSEAIIVSFSGTIAQKYRVGYSYDIGINKLSTISRGTHEITLGLRLPN